MDLLEALGQLGTAADKITGGRALRGTLAGRPRELLSVIPYSDEMGLTDAQDTTGGRDLTDAYGLTSKGDASGSSHALGFLADTILSPGNLLGAYGALKAAPTIAQGVAAGARSLAGLDLFDGFKGAGSHLDDAAAEARLGKFAAHDQAHAGGDLLDAIAPRRAADGAPAAAIEAIDGEMPPHQIDRANDMIGWARIYKDATDAQRNPYLDALGRFADDDLGALMMPNPIDTAARRSPNLNLESRSMNPRRFSADPAKRQFYADWRQARYADRMGGKPIERHTQLKGNPNG